MFVHSVFRKNLYITSSTYNTYRVQHQCALLDVRHCEDVALHSNCLSGARSGILEHFEGSSSHQVGSIGCYKMWYNT